MPKPDIDPTMNELIELSHRTESDVQAFTAEFWRQKFYVEHCYVSAILSGQLLREAATISLGNARFTGLSVDTVFANLTKLLKQQMEDVLARNPKLLERD